ncbi:MAG: type II secretion system F family protein, partial [bacterium]|nr:type II secretion system F family protein [bacterium]
QAAGTTGAALPPVAASPVGSAPARSRPFSRSGASKSSGASARRLGVVALWQLGATFSGLVLGWWATGLLGMSVLLGGLGVLLPPFMAAPRRRRRQSRTALAWQLWTRQLAELARAGAGLTDALAGSVEHCPPELRSTVEKVAVTARLHGVETALDELAASGRTWEPEVAAGLRMAASSGAAVAPPLLDLGERIGDVVDLHRTKTESVVSLWTQTIALLVLAAGVILLMYRNNPAYFEPYRAGGGQLVLIAISGLLLLSVSFLVFHSVVREKPSVMAPPGRRDKQLKEPL